MARKLPHTAKTCADACVRPSLLCAGWLAKLGANALPGESVSRLWDALVLEGDVLPHAAAAFLKVEGDAVRAEARRCSTTGGTTENGVSGAALLDAAERAAAAHFETDDVVADAVFQRAPRAQSADWARARADVHAARRDEPRLRRELRRASARAVPGKRFFFGNQFEEGLVSADAFASLVNAAYVAESRAAAAAAAAAFEEARAPAAAARRRGVARRVPPQRERGAARVRAAGGTARRE